MAVPSYTTDLTDIDLAAAITAWAEPTDAAWDDCGGPTADADYPWIQGSTGMAISQTCTKATIGALMVNAGGGLTIPTDGAVLIWQAMAQPMAMDSLANGGMRVMAGSGLGAFYWWASGGYNAAPYPEGLFQNAAVNPSVTAGRTAVGSPSGTWQYFGSAVKLTVAIGKGNPHAADAVRYGRCEARFSGGSLADGYCTVAGYAAVDNAQATRWALIRPARGGYLWKGLWTVGYGGTAADFRDSDIKIFIDNTVNVTSGFNKLEVRVAATKFYLTRVNIEALGTVSPGSFEQFDSSDVQLDSCQFTGWGAWTFQAAAVLTSTTWLRCGVITAPGCSMLGCKALLSSVAAAASAVVWDVATDPDGYLDDMTFSKGTNAHHALTLGTSSPTSVTLNGWTTSGFNASNAQNDSTFYVARTTGAVTINVVGGNGNFSYKTAGATVTVIQDAVTTQVTCLDNLTKDPIEGVAVSLWTAGSGPYPYDATVTITRTSSTAYVAHTAHGLVTGDKVVISGAVQNEYNRIKTITRTSDNEYTYAVSGSPATPATGTIKSSMVLIDGLTSAAGTISDSRIFSGSQDVAGYAAKGTSSPVYIRAELVGTVDSAAGLPLIAMMIPDE